MFTKTFDILAKIINENQNLGLICLHFKFKSLYLCICIIGAKNIYSCWNIVTFDKQYLATGLKTQNVKKLILDLIFIDNFC
jgi:hypothetical protein